MGAQDTAPRLFVVGADHPPDESSSGLLAGLGGQGIAHAALLPHDGGAFLALAEIEPAAARAALSAAGLTDISLANALFGEAAARSVLERMAVADTDALNRYEAESAAAGMLGVHLAALFDAARRVCNRAAGGAAGLSGDLPGLIRALAENVHGPLANCRALGLGDGAFAETVLGGLRAAGVSQISVTAPQLRNAERLAFDLGGHFGAMEELPALLADADIVVTDIGDGRHHLSLLAVEEALRERRHKPILIINGGMPGDVAPAIDGIDDAFLFTIDDLERMALESLSGEPAPDLTGGIVEQELRRYLRLAGGNELAEAGEMIRASLAALAREKGLADDFAAPVADRMTERLAGHSDADGNLPAALLRTLKSLFGAAGPGDDTTGKHNGTSDE